MKKYKILVVDYEPRSVEQIRRALGDRRFELEIASNGIEAVQAFHRVQPDLTLIEAMIPKKHGFEVCQELKDTAHGKATPILIATSVYKGRKYRHQAMHHYGANGYIEKPVSDEHLLGAVRDALGDDSLSLDAAAIDPAVAAGAGDAGTDRAEARPAEPSGAPPAQQTRQTKRADDEPPTDPTEIEILERLDSLIPGDPGDRR